MKLLDEKNRSYKDVARCLVTYNEILPIMEGAESQPARNRQKYLNHYAQEIERFKFAVKRLEQHNVKLNVDPDKVTALVQEQDRKVSALNETFKEAQSRLVAIRQAQNVVTGCRGKRKEREFRRLRGMRRKGDLHINLKQKVPKIIYNLGSVKNFSQISLQTLTD